MKEKKDEIIKFRISKEQKNLLKRMADKNKENLSQMARNKLLKGLWNEI